MSETTRIVQQLKQGFEGPCWSGPALMQVLDGVDVITASAKPIPKSHSIWELVMHLIAGQQWMLKFISGEVTKQIDTDDWWLEVPESLDEGSWTSSLELLKSQEEELRNAIASFPDDRLDQPLVEGGSAAYNNFHGHVQHTLYHAGQILMLKRAQGVE